MTTSEIKEQDKRLLPWADKADIICDFCQMEKQRGFSVITRWYPIKYSNNDVRGRHFSICQDCLIRLILVEGERIRTAIQQQGAGV